MIVGCAEEVELIKMKRKAISGAILAAVIEFLKCDSVKYAAYRIRVNVTMPTGIKISPKLRNISFGAPTGKRKEITIKKNPMMMNDHTRISLFVLQ